MSDPSAPTPTGHQRTTGGNFRWEPPTPEELQALMPGYTIEKILGRGGMGAVYKGVQMNLDRTVAIKVLPPGVEKEDPSFAERFKSEAKLMAKLNHPAVVAVYDFGTTLGGQLYFAMEYVDGSDVSQMIRTQGRLPPEHALAITAHVCDALAAAHELGIVHRDIKPANVLLNMKGQVKVADFGLAKVEEPGQHGLTKTGYAMGTPDFVAPEVLMLGSGIDGRADLYAVGVMLYQMLTGEVPRGAFKPASVRMPGLDRRYDPIIIKAMQSDREERYQSSAELRRDLDVILTVPLVKQDDPASAAIPVSQVAQMPAQRSAAQKPIGKPPQAPDGRRVRQNAESAPANTPNRTLASAPTAKSKAPLFIGLGIAAAAAIGAFILFSGGKKPAPSVVQASGLPVKAAGTAATPSPAPAKPVVPPKSEPKPLPASASTSSSTIASATQSAPFMNSLGMKFVPVPILSGPTASQRVLFGVWDVRVQDYAAYAKARESAGKKVDGGWKTVNRDGVPVGRDLDHPVVSVSWEDAHAFCQWLTEKEIAEGKLPKGMKYRLPSDEEWSWAVGLPPEVGGTPAEKSGKNTVDFPWGKDYPPTKKVGNYADETFHAKFPKDSKDKEKEQQWIKDYTDGYATTSPVGSFPANAYGLYGMSGNVWQWCEDWFDASQKDRLLRGGSWGNYDRINLMSSYRSHHMPVSRGNAAFGFRCVVSAVSASSAAAMPAVPTTTPATPEPAKPAAAMTPAPAAPPAAAPSLPTSPSPSLLPELATLDEQFKKLQAERVSAPFEADVAKLNSGYLGGLDRKMAEEKAAGHLDSVLAIEAEKQRVTDQQPLPSAEDDATSTTTPAVLKGLRQIYRDAYAKIEATRAANLKALTDPLTARLKTLESDLTKKDRIADAKTVKEYREGLGQSGPLSPLSGTSIPTATGAAQGIPSGASQVRTTLDAAALKDGFTNSLGMKFVPVPGTDVLFCIHETRYKDYAAYAAEAQGVESSWKDQSADGFTPTENKEDHPVMRVSWEDTQAYCAWLTKKEGKTYRLPTDQEWSYAVGIGRDEKWKKDTTPATVTKSQTDFPWGDKWPPPKGSGNYSDDSRKAKEPNATTLEGYDDGFPATAPVMSFKPNKHGLYDLGGNVWEWCEDWYDNTQKVLRGCSWYYGSRGIVLSSHRDPRPSGFRSNYIGFRCVLDTRSPSPATTKPTTPPPPPPPTPAPAAKSDFTNTLGMKFVKVPGTQVLFCIHETRRQDYAAYAAAVPGVDDKWMNAKRGTLPVGGADDHPAINVSWEDARSFAAWLSQKEGRRYRLPKDLEWSYALGIGRDEDKKATPEAKSVGGPNEYLWGKDWPPPSGAGNFADEATKAQFPEQSVIEGYQDGYPTTAPVMMFKPTKNGIYDMGGNAWEWCEDWWNSTQTERVIRGSHWNAGGILGNNTSQSQLRASQRYHYPQDSRQYLFGFRIVIEMTAP